MSHFDTFVKTKINYFFGVFLSARLHKYFWRERILSHGGRVTRIFEIYEEILTRKDLKV